MKTTLNILLIFLFIWTVITIDGASINLLGFEFLAFVILIFLRLNHREVEFHCNRFINHLVEFLTKVQ